MKLILLFTCFTLLTFQLFAQPANDEPCAATLLTVDASCTFNTYNSTGATASVGPPAPGCGNYTTGDIWFKVTVPASGNILIDSKEGSITDSDIAIYNGTCGSLNLIECDDYDSPNGWMASIYRTGLTPGETIWIRVWDYNGTTGTFDMCITTLNPPSNDEPCNAIALTAGTTCNYTTGTNIDATSSSGPPNPVCDYYLGGDVWYKTTIPFTGGVHIDTRGIDITDGGMEVYTGTCNSLTLHSCDANSSNNTGDMPLIVVSDQAPGTEIFIRFWSYGNAELGDFEICTQMANTCGNLLNNDFCSNPATLTKEPGQWSANTSSLFTIDTPDNINSVFCGTVDNNSWYEFTATATSDTFNFTTVNNCANAQGIQAQVFEVNRDANGCCSGFSAMSNCWSPGTESSGQVIATGLTIGNQYTLMIDGFSGDDCDFTVTDWTAFGILLPIEIISFEVKKIAKSTEIQWTTSSEEENSIYTLSKSLDGVNYILINTQNSQQSLNTINRYTYLDESLSNETVYYKLIHINQNGEKSTPLIRSIQNKQDENKHFQFYPNPSNGWLTFKQETPLNGTIILQNSYGQTLLEIQTNQIEQEINLNQFSKGLYIIYFKSDNTNSHQERLLIK
jgi:hypothetical protein